MQRCGTHAHEIVSLFNAFFFFAVTPVFEAALSSPALRQCVTSELQNSNLVRRKQEYKCDYKRSNNFIFRVRALARLTPLSSRLRLLFVLFYLYVHRLVYNALYQLPFF